MKFSVFSKFTTFFITFTKKVLRVERADMRKLVVAICLLNVAVPVHDESRKGEANRKRKLYSKQLWSVDWVLSRAEWVPAEGSWTCLRHWKAILAEDKRWSCPSSWGHSKNHLTFQSSRDCMQHLTRWAGTTWQRCRLQTSDKMVQYIMQKLAVKKSVQSKNKRKRQR